LNVHVISCRILLKPQRPPVEAAVNSVSFDSTSKIPFFPRKILPGAVRTPVAVFSAPPNTAATFVRWPQTVDELSGILRVKETSDIEQRRKRNGRSGDAISDERTWAPAKAEPGRYGELKAVQHRMMQTPGSTRGKAFERAFQPHGVLLQLQGALF